MNAIERFRAVVGFKPFDRLPLLEWASWWDKTIERWHGEGLPTSVVDRYDITRHFGLDLYLQEWVAPRRPGCPGPKSHGSGIIETDDDYSRLRPLLYPEDPVDLRRLERWAAMQNRGDAVIWFSLDGFFWFARTLLGIERHLFAFYDQPELLHRINADLADWMLAMIDRIGSVCEPAFMTFAEDMSYNHGPMLSEDLFDAFMKPYYARVIPALKARGILPVVDSDGDVTCAASWFEGAGIEGILPLERQAGVDIARLRAEHPRMTFIGHFDKMTMPRGEAAMRAEFERLLPVAARGGFLPSCDHQTPPGVSYSQYLDYLRLFREFAERTGKASSTSSIA